MFWGHFGVIWYAISDLEHAPLYAIFPPCHALVELHFYALSLVNALCMHSMYFVASLASLWPLFWT